MIRWSNCSLFNGTFELQRLYFIEWCSGMWRIYEETVCMYFTFLGRTVTYQDKSSEYSIFGPRIKHSTRLHWTATVSASCLLLLLIVIVLDPQLRVEYRWHRWKCHLQRVTWPCRRFWSDSVTSGLWEALRGFMMQQVVLLGQR